MGIRLSITRISPTQWELADPDDWFGDGGISSEEPVFFWPLAELAQGQTIADFRSLTIEKSYWGVLANALATPAPADPAPATGLLDPGEDAYLDERHYLARAIVTGLAETLRAIPAEAIRARVRLQYADTGIDIGRLPDSIADAHQTLADCVAAAAAAGEALGWRIG